MTKTDAFLYQLAEAIIDNIHIKNDLEKEVLALKKENKIYKDMVFQQSQTPHPAEAMLKLMASGHVTIHQSKNE